MAQRSWAARSCPMSGGQTEKQVQLIIDFAPDVIMVTPSYMLNICEEFIRQGIDPRTCSLKIGIFGAEPWTEAMRSDIEQRVDIDAIDLYGLSEVMGPGVACECIEAKDGAVDLGRPLPARDRRPGDRRGAPRWRGRRAGLHVADERSAAGHPLPHARSDEAAAPDGAFDAANGQGDGADRRHADHSRRERVSIADRRAHRRSAAPGAALRPRSAARRHARPSRR